MSETVIVITVAICAVIAGFDLFTWALCKAADDD